MLRLLYFGSQTNPIIKSMTSIKLKQLSFGLILLIFQPACGQIIEDELLIYRLMMTQPDKFRNYLLEPDKYELQIIYTQINRDSLNRPQLKEFVYNLNPQKYFNPASLVKLPVALLTLEKLNEQKHLGIDKYTKIGFGTNYACQTPVNALQMPSQESPSLARYLEKMLLVSDNEGYTRLYEFLGQRYIQQKMNEKCYEGVRIIRRFNTCDTLQNRYTNPIYFYNNQNQLIYTQAGEFNPSPYYPRRSTWQINPNPSGIPPLDPNYENFVPLNQAHRMLVAVMMPEALPTHQRFNLNEGDYRFLQRGLGAYPHEGRLATYLPKDGYHNAYKKYLYFGRTETTVNPQLRVFNIVGWWSGYVSDCAYLVDYQQGIEFFLSVVISTNQVPINEGEGYQKISFPFMADLGKIFYEYERQRNRRFKPDLSKYRFF
jgi:hypothetical protein